MKTRTHILAALLVTIPVMSAGGQLATTRAGAGPTTADRASTRLVFREANAVLDQFTIKFSARPNASPTVVYSTQPPVRAAHGPERLIGKARITGWSFASPLSASVAGGSGDGATVTYVAWSRERPERGQTYYFIITIPAGGAGEPEEQYTGHLTTVNQRARIVLTQINVTQARTGGVLKMTLLVDSSYWNFDALSSIGTHSVDGVELTKENAPDRLPVSVEATMYLGHMSNTNYNSAHREIDIGTSRLERYVKIPFTIRSSDQPSATFDSTSEGKPFNYSRPNDPGGLMFEASGYIEVTRQ